MKDITSFNMGADMNVMESIAPKAANVLQIQIGDLEYAPTFGIDIAFFMDPDFIFQNESFKSYLIQRLSESNVNVNQVIELLDRFVNTYSFYVGTAQSDGGFIK